MKVAIGEAITLPRFQPYPRHGRVVGVDDGTVQVDGISCGDPRCAAEHVHGAQTWSLDEIESAGAYQPRAAWEHGRKTSPNAPLA